MLGGSNFSGTGDQLGLVISKKSRGSGVRVQSRK
jgi:hypothetical protein